MLGAMDRRKFTASLATALSPDAAAQPCVELRAYRTQPGRRDELIDLFEQNFLDAYEQGGARILGSFRTPDDPDRWVWLRAFDGPLARREALEAFYSSAAWLAGRDACNATIADTRDAWLLREADGAGSPAPPSPAAQPGCYLLELHRPSARESGSFVRDYRSLALPLSRDLGAVPLLQWVEDRRKNLYPRQHLRSGATFVLLTRFVDASMRDTFLARRRATPAWSRRVRPRLLSRLSAAPWVLRLDPTSRSRLR